jgi:hypothetical protein
MVIAGQLSTGRRRLPDGGRGVVEALPRLLIVIAKTGRYLVLSARMLSFI